MTKRINKILWNGTEVPKASTHADGLDGLNLGELFIKNDPQEPGVYTRTTDGKVVSLGGGIDKYFHRLFVAIDANGNEIAPNDTTTPIASVRVNYGLWTEQFLSAKGMNSGGGSDEPTGGATTLGGLRNVAADADRTYDVAKMLVLEAKSNLWSLKNLSELVGGLDEAELAEYLTTNNYAKKSDIPSLEGYATEQWVLGKGYLTEHQDLSAYAKKTDIPTIPTKVSAFVNDANYATTSDLDTRIDALVNGAPAAYDTLKEIADVLAGNVDSIADILDALGTKVSKTDFNTAIANVNTAIDSLNTELGLKLDAVTFNELFEKVQLEDGTWAIKAKLGLFSDGFISAKGSNVGGTSSEGGAVALYQLNDVYADGTQVSGAKDGAVFVYDGKLGKWKGVAQSEIVPNLTGYAKESWVLSQGFLTQHQDLSDYAKLTDIPTIPATDINKGVTAYGWGDHSKVGYLTGITSKLVTDALGYTPYDAANFTKAKIKSTLGISDWALASSKPSYKFSEITEKPTTISGYGITDALTALTSSADTNLSITVGGTTKTITGLYAKYTNFFINKWNYDSGETFDLNEWNTGGIVRCYGNPSKLLNKPDGFTYGSILALSHGGTALTGQLAWAVNHNSTTDTTKAMWFRVNDSANGYTYAKWHQIAFIDSNVASATKLQTARTIWGQSFDGTGNISGALSGVTTLTASGSATIGSTLYMTGTGSQIDASIVFSRSHSYIVMPTSGGFNVAVDTPTSANTIVRFASSKNVLIGTTTDSGYKLDVNGTTRTTKLVIGNGSIEWDDTNKGFKIVGGLYTESYLSAKGANSSGGSTSGGGLIESLWKVGDLGKTFNTNANDTFNAYAINAIHNRVSVLEGKATNVSFTQSLTSGTQIGTITIDGAAKNIYAPTIPTKLSQFTNDLGLGSFAYKSSLAFADLTNKPTTISGYGITDAITTANIGSQSVANANQLKYTSLTSGEDMNTYYGDTYNGKLLYKGSSIDVANFPFSSGGVLLIRTAGGTYTTQLAFSSAGQMAIRRVYNTSQTNWRTILHSENYDDYTYSKSTIDTKLGGYLPLSGGTLTSNGVALTIKRYTANPIIGFNGGAEDANERYGYLGFSGKDRPAYIDATGSVVYPIIHSGNIGSQSVSYASDADKLDGMQGNLYKKLNGGTSLAPTSSNLVDLNNIISFDTYYCSPNASAAYVSNKPYTTNTSFRLEVMTTTGTGASYIRQMLYRHGSNNIYTRYSSDSGTNWADWEQFAYLTSNVASATKLQTARTIWGQSFDGTGDVSGALSGVTTITTSGAVTVGGLLNINGGALMQNAWYIRSYLSDGTTAHNIIGLNASNSLLINYGATAHNSTANIYGNKITLAAYADGASVSSMTWDGNLGVGTTSPKYKAHINGTLYASNAVTLGGTAADTANLAFSRSSYNYITFPTDGSLCLSTATSTSGIVLRVTSTAIEPMTTATKSVGTSSKRWGAIYGVDGDFSGTLHATTGIYSDGYVSAKGQNTSSDMRLKNVLNDVVLNVKDIANAPSIRFAWKNGGGVDVGSSAQYWQGLLPDAVKERDGMLEMQYANIALLSAIAIAKNVETHEERIARLERENKELRNEINCLKYGA